MFDAKFFEDPYPTYDDLRSAGRAVWVPEFLGGTWLITGYNDVNDALHDPRLSARRSGVFTGQLPPEARHELSEFDRIFAMWMLFLDPPQHSRLRRLMQKGFTNRLLQDLRPRIQTIADNLLDHLTSDGQMEFIADFAHPPLCTKSMPQPNRRSASPSVAVSRVGRAGEMPLSGRISWPELPTHRSSAHR